MFFKGYLGTFVLTCNLVDLPFIGNQRANILVECD